MKKGEHHSEATKRKMSEAGKGRHHSIAARQKISEAQKGKHHPPHSEAHRCKISKSVSEACKRQTAKGGHGYNFVGYHELMLPLLYLCLTSIDE